MDIGSSFNLIDNFETIDACPMNIPQFKRENANSKKYAIIIKYLHVSLVFYILQFDLLYFITNCGQHNKLSIYSLN